MQWFKMVETRGHIRDGMVVRWQGTRQTGFTLE